MTINKFQEQTVENIGVLLSRATLTPGQLWVVASKNFEYNGQGHLTNDERVFTKNIVYKKALNH